LFTSTVKANSFSGLISLFNLILKLKSTIAFSRDNPDFSQILNCRLPCQVYQIKNHGKQTTFRVAFLGDLPASGKQRYGVYYDNPKANKPIYQSQLSLSGKGLAREIENDHYQIQIDKITGQFSSIFCKLYKYEGMYPRPIWDGGLQPGPTIILAELKNKESAEGITITAANLGPPDSFEIIEGPVFLELRKKSQFKTSAKSSVQTLPELEMSYKFIENLPYFLMGSKITFKQDTPVFGLRNEMLTFDQNWFTHYTFRPVTPSLPDSDWEEMGHLIVDPQYTKDVPDGNQLSEFLPYNMAWHSFINIQKSYQLGVTSIRLSESFIGPDGPIEHYRSGTFMEKTAGKLTCYRAPIYVKNHSHPDNAVIVPKGTVFEEINAVHFSSWDHIHWSHEIEAIGKALNSPPSIKCFPHHLGEQPPDEIEGLLPKGNFSNRYLKAGLR